MNCAVLFFTLVAAGLVSAAWAQASVDVPQLEQDESPKAVIENDEELSCVPKKSCGPDEVYRCCGPCYQLACRGSVIDCPNLCYADCYCVKGFVREFPGGPCVPDLFCPLVDLPDRSDYDDYDY